LQRLDLSANDISSVGAVDVLTTLKQHNHTLALLNLQDNPVISSVLRKAIDFMLASRQVLNSFRKCLDNPLEKRVMPMAILAMQQNPIYHEIPELARG
jgi:hypothetical protein